VDRLLFEGVVAIAIGSTPIAENENLSGTKVLVHPQIVPHHGRLSLMSSAVSWLFLMER